METHGEDFQKIGFVQCKFINKLANNERLSKIDKFHEF